MNNKHLKQGFTLIELLVVVLIIGILAAVALPQYQKAVEKSKATQAIIVLASLEKATEFWLLENSISGKYSFLGEEFDYGNINSASLNIDLPCEESSMGWCSHNNWEFQVLCTPSSCNVAARTQEGSYQVLVAEHNNVTGKWTHTCGYYDNLGQAVCQGLESQGWTATEGFDY